MGIFLARMMQKRLLTWSKLPLLKSPSLSLGVCGKEKSWLGDFFEFSLWLDRTGGRRRGRRKGLRYTIGVWVGGDANEQKRTPIDFISVCFVHWRGIGVSFLVGSSLISCRWCFFHRVSEWPEGGGGGTPKDAHAFQPAGHAIVARTNEHFLPLKSQAEAMRFPFTLDTFLAFTKCSPMHWMYFCSVQEQDTVAFYTPLFYLHLPLVCCCCCCCCCCSAFGSSPVSLILLSSLEWRSSM